MLESNAGSNRIVREKDEIERIIEKRHNLTKSFFINKKKVSWNGPRYYWISIKIFLCLQTHEDSWSSLLFCSEGVSDRLLTVWPDWAIFLYFLVTNFARKEAQISHLVLGYFEKHHFLIKTVVAIFGHFWKSLGYFLFQHLVTVDLLTCFIIFVFRDWLICVSK